MAYRCFTCYLVVIISCFYTAIGEEQKATLPGWSPWSGWTSCSVTCGYGDMFRQAYWLDSKGQSTNETAQEHMGCYIPKTCPVNGNWTVWSGWYWCSAICGPGRQERYRYCVNPKPANGVCENEPCPTIPPTFRLTACKEEDFMCASGLQCVPDAHRCDRALQCHDGSDEVKCRYVRNKGAIVKTSLTRLSFILMLFFIFVIK